MIGKQRVSSSRPVAQTMFSEGRGVTPTQLTKEGRGVTPTQLTNAVVQYDFKKNVLRCLIH